MISIVSICLLQKTASFIRLSCFFLCFFSACSTLFSLFWWHSPGSLGPRRCRQHRGLRGLPCSAFAPNAPGTAVAASALAPPALVEICKCFFSANLCLKSFGTCRFAKFYCMIGIFLGFFKLISNLFKKMRLRQCHHSAASEEGWRCIAQLITFEDETSILSREVSAECSMVLQWDLHAPETF